jgi:NADH dehydrogenase [ubiquinone] 1 alpha subcomplex assembly factor 6
VTAETRKGRSHRGAPRGLSPLGDLIRRHDRDRYQTALFAPADRREALFALYAFNYEIARVRESVTQPMLGQIRLQWWREVIEAAYGGEAPRRHEVALPLTTAIRDFGLSRPHFDRMIDAREADLSDELPADIAALEDYVDGTSAELMRLALDVLGTGYPQAEVAAPTLTLPRKRGWAGSGLAAEAAAEVGTGYALAGLLRAMPFHARTGRCYIPVDVAAEAGLDLRDYSRLRPTAGLRRAVSRIAETAESHLASARQLRAEVPRGALPALLPGVIAERALARLRRAGWNPFDPRLAAPDTLQSWRLAAAAWRGRF